MPTTFGKNASGNITLINSWSIGKAKTMCFKPTIKKGWPSSYGPAFLTCGLASQFCSHHIISVIDCNIKNMSYPLKANEFYIMQCVLMLPVICVFCILKEQEVT